MTVLAYARAKHYGQLERPDPPPPHISPRRLCVICGRPWRSVSAFLGWPVCGQDDRTDCLAARPDLTPCP